MQNTPGLLFVFPNSKWCVARLIGQMIWIVVSELVYFQAPISNLCKKTYPYNIYGMLKPWNVGTRLLQLTHLFCNKKRQMGHHCTRLAGLLQSSQIAPELAFFNFIYLEFSSESVCASDYTWRQNQYDVRGDFGIACFTFIEIVVNVVYVLYLFRCTYFLGSFDCANARSLALNEQPQTSWR